MKIIWIILLTLIGCSHPELKPDPSLGPLQANYPTAEFQACGQIWHGLGVCPLYSDAFLDTLDLKVQGYFDGEIRVYAESTKDDGCKMDQHFSYKDSELVSIPLPDIASSCTFSISVTPHFPDQDDQSSVQVKSLPGFLRVRKLDYENIWFGDILRNPENAQNFFVIPTTDKGRAIASIRGCGIVFDGMLDASHGQYNIDLNSKGLVSISKLCTLEGVIFGNNLLQWTGLVDIYNQSFVPLAAPLITPGRNQISIYADPTVSAIFLDDQYKLSNQGVFSFDPSVTHVVRLLTASARSIIGQYDPKNGVWVWK
jgi:hypothetical protein